MDSGEEILLQLLLDIAPQAVRSFIHLAQIGVFDGQPIGRIAPGQCIDVSYRAFHDPRAKYMIHNDTLSGRYLPVAFGRVAMGGYGDDAISGGEFFFPLQTIDRWTGHFPVFGTVLDGLAVLRRLENVPLRFSGYEPYPGVKIMEPAEPEIIRSIHVDCMGQIYAPPQVLSDIEVPDNWQCSAT